MKVNNIDYGSRPDTGYTERKDSVGIRPGTNVPASASSASDRASLPGNAAASESAANLSTVFEALREAGLNANRDNIALVNALLTNSMSISRDNLRNIHAQLLQYPETDLNTLLMLNRADIPVSSDSIATMDAFLSNTGILNESINDVLDSFTDLLASNGQNPAGSALMSAASDFIIASVQEGALSISSDFAGAAGFNAADIAGAAGLVNAADIAGAAEAAIASGTADTAGIADTAIASDIAGAAEAAAASGTADTAGIAGAANSQAAPETVNTVNAPGNANATGTAELNAAADLSGTAEALPDAASASLPASTQALGVLASGSPQPAAPGILSEELASIPTRVQASDTGTHVSGNAPDFEFTGTGTGEEAALAGSESGTSSQTFLSEDTINELSEIILHKSPAELKRILKNALSMRPEDLSKRNVRELYERTVDFINKIRTVSAAIKGGEALNEKASAASRNFEALYNLNSLYPHVELPLKLNNGSSNGELYIYSGHRGRKIDLSRSTALLHLDMPNLGKLDIHLELKAKALNVSFYSHDTAEALLKSFLPELDNRLKEKNFNMTAHFNPKSDDSKEPQGLPITPSGSAKPGASDTPRLGFDVKA